MCSYILERPLLRLGSELARGSYGVVHEGFYNENKVAVKQVSMDKVFGNYAKFHQHVFKEFDALQLCSDLASVCKAIGIVISIHKCYIVMEQYDESLDTYINSIQLSPAGKVDICFQCVEILRDVCYRMQFIHGDIKPANLMVRLNGDFPKVYLSDFGCVTNLVEGDLFITPERETSSWDPKYYYCNAKRGTKNEDLSVDLFAMMFVLVEVMFGRKKVYLEARSKKVIDLQYCAGKYGVHALKFIGICHSVIQLDFTPRKETYNAFLDDLKVAISDASYAFRLGEDDNKEAASITRSALSSSLWGDAASNSSRGDAGRSEPERVIDSAVSAKEKKHVTFGSVSPSAAPVVTAAMTTPVVTATPAAPPAVSVGVSPSAAPVVTAVTAAMTTPVVTATSAAPPALSVAVSTFPDRHVTFASVLPSAAPVVTTATTTPVVMTAPAAPPAVSVAVTRDTHDRHVSSRDTRDHHVSSRDTRDHHVSSRDTRDRHVSSRDTRDHHVSSRDTRDHHVSSRDTRDRHVSTRVERDVDVSTRPPLITRFADYGIPVPKPAANPRPPKKGKSQRRRERMQREDPESYNALFNGELQVQRGPMMMAQSTATFIPDDRAGGWPYESTNAPLPRQDGILMENHAKTIATTLYNLGDNCPQAKFDSDRIKKISNVLQNSKLDSVCENNSSSMSRSDRSVYYGKVATQVLPFLKAIEAEEQDDDLMDGGAEDVFDFIHSN